jgi:hypothetical protein
LLQSPLGQTLKFDWLPPPPTLVVVPFPPSGLVLRVEADEHPMPTITAVPSTTPQTAGSCQPSRLIDWLMFTISSRSKSKPE